MGNFYEAIPDNLLEWIPTQEAFWVATAPLAGDGHVNVSPKGLRGTFHVESPTRVWYEDMTGSGSETIAHLRENGRITILFNAFVGAPRIVRLFGTGKAHEFGSAEYDALVPASTRTPGSRAVIVIEVHKVGSSCGYSVPYFSFQGHRTVLTTWSAAKEKRDLAYAVEHPDAPPEEMAERGMRAWWREWSHSVDGLPSLLECFETAKPLEHSIDVEGDAQAIENQYRKQLKSERDGENNVVVVKGVFGPAALVTTFAAGAVMATIVSRYGGLLMPAHRS